MAGGEDYRPHGGEILSPAEGRAVRVRAFLLSLSTALLLVATSGLVAAPSASAQTTAEARLVARINAVRAGAGLAPLVVRSRLTQYARAHSAAMAQQRTLFHTTSFAGLCCWSAIAENVGFGAGVAGVHQAFLGSPAHLANILDPRMRSVGVGVHRSGDRIWVTEIFKAPR